MLEVQKQETGLTKRAIILGCITSVVFYLLAPFGLNVVGGSFGKILFTTGIVLSSPGETATTSVGLDFRPYSWLLPILVNAFLYSLLWWGILNWKGLEAD